MFVHLDLPWGGQGHLNVTPSQFCVLIKWDALYIFKVTLLKKLSGYFPKFSFKKLSEWLKIKWGCSTLLNDMSALNII